MNVKIGIMPLCGDDSCTLRGTSVFRLRSNNPKVRVSVKPGTHPEHPGTPPEHPGTPPEHHRNSPEQPRNTPGTSHNTPEHPRNSKEHPWNTKNSGQRSDCSRID